MTSPYNKGPLREGEIPRLIVGAGILFGGLYAVTRYLTDHTRAVATATAAANPVGPVATRGSRFR